MPSRLAAWRIATISACAVGSLSPIGRGDLLQILQALARNDGAALISRADALEARGLSFGAALEELAAMLQTLALLQLVPQAADADDPQHAALTELAGLLGPELVQLAYSTVLHGRNELSLAPDDRTGFTMTLLRLLAFAPVVAGSVPAGGLPLSGPVTAGSTPARAEVDVGSAPPQADPADEAHPSPAAAGSHRTRAVPAQPPTAARAAVEPERSTAPEGQAGWPDWPTLAQQLDLPPGLPRALAQQSERAAVDGLQWLLRVPNDQLCRAGALDKLQAAVRAATGVEVVLRAESGEVRDSAAQREARARAQAQADAEAVIHGDPLVQQLVQELGAQIVPGSLKPSGADVPPQLR